MPGLPGEVDLGDADEVSEMDGLMTAEQRASVLAGRVTPLPQIASIVLADGREMRCGETWSYNNGPARALSSVEGRPGRHGVGEPYPQFVNADGTCLGFDAVLGGDAATWRRVR